jgi:metallo-beta-lactamase family protein
LNTIRLKFLGAIGTVSGSCTLMEYNGNHYYLIDAGIYQNEGNSEEIKTRKEILRKYIKNIEIIFITHAHLDHIGLLPELIKWGFTGKIFGTKATVELTKVMLEDAMKINGNYDPEIIKRMNFFEFDKNQGEKTFNGFGKKYVKIEKDFTVTILRSSHILGSCTWLFRWSEHKYEEDVLSENKEWKYIYFSGDIGPTRGNNNPNILFKEHQIPFQNSDKVIILESTYGMIIRPKNNNLYKEKIDKLAKIIFTNIENNKFILLPVFALDRAQQVLIDLFYIISKYTINEKKWHEIISIDWYKFLQNTNKENIIESVNNIIQLTDKTKKKWKGEINSLFGKNILFQELAKEKQDEVVSMFEKGKNIMVGIKSPLIKKINEIYLNQLTDDVYSKKDEKQKYKYLSDEFLCRFDIKNESVSMIEKENIKKILEKCFNKTEYGNIVVSASGMCDEGSVLELLKIHLKDENSTIILTGYQTKDTNGFLIKNYSEGKYDEDHRKNIISLNKIDMKLSDIKCKIEDLSSYYSGHADQEQLINYIFESSKDTERTTVLLNHGSIDSLKELKKAFDQMENKNILILLPEYNKWFNIFSKEYELNETDENDGKMEYESVQQFRNINIDEMHIYFPIEYDEEKIRKIIEYIKII